MYKDNNLVKITTMLLVAAIFAALFAISPALAQEEAPENTEETQTLEATPANEEEPEEQEENQGESAASYTFTAQSGDSYTEIARKVTQIYGIETETELSGEQIVFVETNLTIAAGSPELNLGQEVTISQSLVSEWVEAAKNLNEGELALWAKYASVVDFNTDSVGEPSA